MCFDNVVMSRVLLPREEDAAVRKGVPAPAGLRAGGIERVLKRINATIMRMFIVAQVTQSHTNRPGVVEPIHCQVWTTIFDVHCNVFLAFVPVFPILGGFCDGLLCKAGVPLHWLGVSYIFKITNTIERRIRRWRCRRCTA